MSHCPRELWVIRRIKAVCLLSEAVSELAQVVDDPSGNKMLLVMEYMEGGTVMTREALERGRCIPEPLALQYFRDMCKVHLPLKPSYPFAFALRACWG